jgi:hypothetical protein
VEALKTGERQTIPALRDEIVNDFAVTPEEASVFTDANGYGRRSELGNEGLRVPSS